MLLAVVALVVLIPAIVLEERDRTTAELRDSEERFRNLTAAAFEGIAISQNGRLVDANEQLLRMFRCGRAEMIGREVLELVAPESRSIVAESIRLGREEIFEHRLLRQDGSSFYAEARAKTVRVGDQSLRMAALRDITDRKQAEQALRESEERYRALVEFLPDAVAVSVDDRLVYLNPAGVKMIQVGDSEDPTKLIGRSVYDFTPVSFHDAMRERRRKVLQGGIVEPSIEGPLLRSDGSSILVEALAVPFTYAGRPAILNLIRDITERKRAEELTRTQRQVLEMIAIGKTMPETLDALLRIVEVQSPEMLCSILLLDPDGIHIRHGAAPSLPAAYSKAIDGAAIGPVAGSCGTAAFRREAVFVADIASDPLWADYKQLALPHGLRACWSTPIFDAQRNVLGTFAMYFRQPGLPNEWHLRLIDMVTQTAAICVAKHRSDRALRDSETRLRMLTDASFEGIGIAQDGMLIDANDQLVKMLGYRARSEMIGKPAIEFAAPESREYVMGLIKSGRTAPYEHLAIRKDGTVFPVEVCGRIIATEPHRISLAAVRDITERKRAEEALRESEERLALVFNSTSDIMTLYEVMPDGKYRLVTANRAFFEKAWSSGSEVERKDIIGKSDDELTGKIFRLDTGDLLQRRTKMRQAISSGRTVLWEEASKTPTGTTFSERADIPILDRQGRCRHLLRVAHDVTERKLAEQALRESEERYRTVVEFFPECVAVSVDDRLVYVNPAGLKLVGLEGPEGQAKLIGHSVYDFMPAAQHEFIREERREVLQRGVAGPLIQGSMMRPDGSTVMAEGQAIPFVYDGRPAILSVIRDITERKRAEAALRESEEKFSKAFRSCPDAVALSELETGRYIDVNEGYERVFGFSRDEVIGRTSLELGIFQEPKDRGRIVEELSAQGMVRGIELRCLKRQCEPLTCLYGGELIDLGGRPCVVSVIHDITDRVRAEAALRENERVLSTLMSNLPGMVYRCQNDADWTMLFVSEGCRDLTGYAPEDLLGNRKTSYGEIILSDDQGAVFETVQTALRKRQPFELSYRIRTATDTEKWVWERGRGIFSENDELLALEGFVTDVTAKRRAEIESAHALLREQRAREEYTGRLIASQEAERRRIAGELHDSLGQNLLLIKNRAHLALTDKLVPTHSRTQLEVIQELTTQAISEVRQISQGLHPYQLDQLGLTRAMAAMIDKAAQSGSIVFERKLEIVDDVFRGEAATNLYRVVQETVNNILKHSQASRARIVLERDVHDVRLWIEDDGRGFGAVPPAGDRGFGLKNVAERVRILGGSLKVDSRPGGGTRVEAIVPITERG
jgi:PAS domain S-box-containing protein